MKNRIYTVRETVPSRSISFHKESAIIQVSPIDYIPAGENPFLVWTCLDSSTLQRYSCECILWR